MVEVVETIPKKLHTWDHSEWGLRFFFSVLFYMSIITITFVDGVSEEPPELLHHQKVHMCVETEEAVRT